MSAAAMSAAGAPMLFALGSSKALGERIAAAAGQRLCAHEEREFEDGEHKARPLECVRGGDTYVIHSLYGEPGQSPNDKLCRLLFFIGALRDAGAARISAVVPYLAYARKDRKTRQDDPVTTRYVAALLEAAGADVVLTMDVHNLAAYQNAFRRCRTEHLEAAALFASQFTAAADGRLAVVSPDAGGAKRADQFRQLLLGRVGGDVGWALAEKYRSGGVVSGELLVGDVQDCTAILVDDLVSTGATLVRAARACLAHGAGRVVAVATHGAFSAGASEALADPAIEQLIVTDTVAPGRLSGTAAAKLTVIGCAHSFGLAVRALNTNAPIEFGAP